MQVLIIIWLATLVAGIAGPLWALNAYPNIFLYRILFFIHLAVFAYLLIKRQIHIKLPKQTKKIYIFLAIWFLYAVFSFLWADNKFDAIRYLWFLFSGLSLVFFTSIYMNQKGFQENLLDILAFSLVCVMLVGVWEIQTGLHLKTAGGLDLKGYFVYMPRGVFKNPNDMATYLTLFVPFLYMLAKYRQKLLVKALAWTGLAIYLYVIVNSGSRANMLAIPLMVLAAIIISLIRNKTKGLKNIACFVGIVLLLFTIANTLSPQFNRQFARQKSLLNHHIGSFPNQLSEEPRVILANRGLKILKEHYLMGVGVGNVNHHMEKYSNDELSVTPLHNWWMEVLVTYGVLIWILYLWFFVTLAWLLFKIVLRAPPGITLMLAEGSLLAFVGFPLSAVSSSCLAYARFMWILFGVALCVVNAYHSTSSEGENPNESTLPC